jgi:probable selenium-dependent hydroxylase accessory protein YqeC
MYFMDILDFLTPDGNGCTAVIGGGGKTTLLAKAAGIAVEKGRRLVLSTSTKLQRPCPFPETDIHISSDTPPTGIQPGCPVLWVGRASEDGSKWLAPDSGSIDKLCRELTADSTLLIEADGSAGRPVKAPGPNEPVIPAFTDTVVAVIGLSALYRPVNDKTIHRIQSFLDIIRSSRTGTIEPQHLATLITDPGGSFKGVRSGMRRLLILNQADRLNHIKDAEVLARTVINSGCGIEAVAITNLNKASPIQSIISL